MARPFQGIRARSSELRAEGFQQFGMCQQFVLHHFGKRQEFRLEHRIEKDGPLHTNNMTLKTYVVNNIFR